MDYLFCFVNGFSSRSFHFLRFFDLIQYHSCYTLSMTFFQCQIYFPILFKSTFYFDNVFSVRTTTSSLNAWCRDSNHVDIINFTQINVVAQVGSPEAFRLSYCFCNGGVEVRHRKSNRCTYFEWKRQTLSLFLTSKVGPVHTEQVELS